MLGLLPKGPGPGPPERRAAALEIAALAALAAALDQLPSGAWSALGLALLPLGAIALRHGLGGALAGLCTALAGSYTLGLSLEVARAPLSAAPAAALLLVLSAALCRDHWTERAEHWRRRTRRETARLRALDDHCQLLELSHARLSRRLTAGVGALREALQGVGATGDRAARAAAALQAVEFLGWVQAAAWHWLDAEQRPLPAPAAHIGEQRRLDPPPPMLAEALARGRLLAVTERNASGAQDTPLAVAPVCDRSGRQRAVFCLYRAPFLALTDDNLRLLQVLLRHLGRALDGPPAAAPALPLALADAGADLADFDLPAMLVQWRFADDRAGRTAITFVLDNCRRYDSIDCRPVDGALQLSLLCPMTDGHELNAMVARLREHLLASHQLDLNQLAREHRRHALRVEDEPRALLREWRLTGEG